MIKPGGIILRIVTSPTFHTEYLTLDGAQPQWSQIRADAIFFENYEEADARAGAMGGRPIFAAVATKPIPHRPIPDPHPQIHLRPRTLALTGTQA